LLWVFNAAALIAVAYVLRDGIKIDGFGSALLAALVLSLVNTLIRPILVLLTLPITCHARAVHLFHQRISFLVRGLGVAGFHGCGVLVRRWRGVDVQRVFLGAGNAASRRQKGQWQ